MKPAIVAVAPNGARKTKSDHPAVPLTADELGRCAADCVAAGAAMLHLHVRRTDGRHTLDVDLYRDATEAVRREAGSDVIIQVTSEAAGIYDRHAQMAVMCALMPEACSLAVRELVPDEAAEIDASAFLYALYRAEVMMQYVLYSSEDLRRFRVLKDRGVVPGDRHFVLFVLGRYTGHVCEPVDMLPLLRDWSDDDGLFAICAFGPRESACALVALGLNGHARIGFENNLLLADGSVALDNASLVRQTVAAASVMGRSVARPEVARAILHELQ